MATLGVDLGTSNSAVAYQAADGSVEVVEAQHGTNPYGKAFPSCVEYTPDGTVGTAGVVAWSHLVYPNAHVLRYMKRVIGKSYAEVTADLERLRGMRKLGVSSGSLAFLEALSDRLAKDERSGGLLLRVGETKLKSPVEVVADLLRHMRAEAEARAGERFESAVICVPAYFNANQAEATKQAARTVFDEVRILTEPKAAALAAGAGASGREMVVVYDLGGGTLDVVVAYVDASDAERPDLDISTEMGDSWLGGVDVDGLILERLMARDGRLAGVYPQLSEYERNDVLFNIERAKIVLSTQPAAPVWLTLLKHGFVVSQTITREELGEWMRQPRRDPASGKEYPSFLARCEMVLVEALTEVEILPNHIGRVDRLVMVGGPTRMPAIREMLGRVFAGNERVQAYLAEKEQRYQVDSTATDPEPVELVCRGAAAYAHWQKRQGIVAIDRVPHNYGTWYHTAGFKLLLTQGTRFGASAEEFVQSDPDSVYTEGTAAPKIPVLFEALEGGERGRFGTLAAFVFPVRDSQARVDWELRIAYQQDRTVSITGTYQGKAYDRKERPWVPFGELMKEFLSPYVEPDMEEELWQHGITREIAVRLFREEYQKSPECREAVDRVAAFLGQPAEVVLGRSGKELILLFLRKLFPGRSEGELQQVEVEVVARLDPALAGEVLPVRPGMSLEEIAQLGDRKLNEIREMEVSGKISRERANQETERIRRAMSRQGVSCSGPRDIVDRLTQGLNERESGILADTLIWWRSRLPE